MRCETCGKSVRRGHPRPYPTATDEVDVAGRLFYGLSTEAELCLSCRREVRTLGIAVCDAGRPALCPLCGKIVRSAWGEANAAAAPEPGALMPGDLLLDSPHAAAQAPMPVRPQRGHS